MNPTRRDVLDEVAVAATVPTETRAFVKGLFQMKYRKVQKGQYESKSR